MQSYLQLGAGTATDTWRALTLTSKSGMQLWLPSE